MELLHPFSFRYEYVFQMGRNFFHLFPYLVHPPLTHTLLKRVNMPWYSAVTIVCILLMH